MSSTATLPAPSPVLSFEQLIVPKHAVQQRLLTPKKNIPQTPF